ncbi:hypothetical protein [Aliiroseovarius lamellibrachiae]|uniref:hypothetical protein n=1 Tax=Aliiroseovarius lamellibrachiae TaxID=1924933 RepID=UPI001BDFDBD5|nr:hypothetical protein [Aliiroseovarius lamellibrachiae]MBT2132632.1 hypothetical protein [Aliiroseovarius lamellibrachiae]
MRGLLIASEPLKSSPTCPSVRLTNTITGADTASEALVEKVSYLHTNQLGSVRAITNGAGAAEKHSLYKPFGEEI